MLAPVIVLLAFVAPWTHARIQYFYDCASYFPNTDYIYNTNSTACANNLADSTCQLLYPTVNNAPFPTAGQSQDRPINCYSSPGRAIDQTAVNDATALCPKTCGLCCKLKGYSCKNKEYPRITCSTITASLCRSPQWRDIIAEDCPLSCGFCGNTAPTTPSPNVGGCFDAAADCIPSLCNRAELQSFVDTNCRKTCGKCTNFGDCVV